ncbi:MAG: ammonia-forming cytochrome c nitrite reductase subunit c552, partial [Verrucomicrobiales bacterium]|nr:ammonia-forming cytochrome c nitrite reductase subunit c552 [Verrucomicrobiales bacterium]
MDTAKGPVVAPETEVFAAYAGSASCRDCHAEAFNAWRHSHHGLAEREPAASLDEEAFHPPRTLPQGTGSTGVAWENGRGVVTAAGLGGAQASWPVDRVIGHAPLRQYLVGAGGGRWQTLEATWDPALREWFNVFGAEDRQPGEWGHWTGRGMNWNSMCGTCHNTRFRKNYDPATDTYASAMAERSVGCESCHG